MAAVAVERAAASAGTAFAGAPQGQGYSRRCASDARNLDQRRRLLTDRNAYVAFLEAQAERYDGVSSEVEALGAGLHQVVLRVERLEARARSAEDLVERAAGASSAAARAEETALRAEDTAHSSRRQLQEELRAASALVQSGVDRAFAEARATAEAELARTRNELSLDSEELGQRLEERLRAFGERLLADGGASSAAIEEAQATCARLADDSLSASEAAQRKLEEYQRRTEGSLEVLRVHVTDVRAQLAGCLAAEDQRSSAAAAAPPASPAPAASPEVVSDAPLALGGGLLVEGLSEEGASVLADEIESRLAKRLGQQVLQLSEVLRRVVQSQASLHRRWDAGHYDAGAALDSPWLPGAAAVASGGAQSRHTSPGLLAAGALPAEGSACARAAAAGAVPAALSDRRRREAIDDLYRELRQLERHGGDATR